MIARKPTLGQRQEAFLTTLQLLLDGTVQTIDQSAPVVQAALVNAAATIVVGADLSLAFPVGGVSYTYLRCDDCGRSDGTHDLEVEH